MKSQWDQNKNTQKESLILWGQGSFTLLLCLKVPVIQTTIMCFSSLYTNAKQIKSPTPVSKHGLCLPKKFLYYCGLDTILPIYCASIYYLHDVITHKYFLIGWKYRNHHIIVKEACLHNQSCWDCLTDFNQVQNVLGFNDNFRNKSDDDTFHPHISSLHSEQKTRGKRQYYLTNGKIIYKYIVDRSFLACASEIHIKISINWFKLKRCCSNFILIELNFAKKNALS